MTVSTVSVGMASQTRESAASFSEAGFSDMLSFVRLNSKMASVQQTTSGQQAASAQQTASIQQTGSDPQTASVQQTGSDQQAASVQQDGFGQQTVSVQQTASVQQAASVQQDGFDPQAAYDFCQDLVLQAAAEGILPMGQESENGQFVFAADTRAVRLEAFMIRLEKTLAQMITAASGDEEEKQDQVIRLWLDVLKKMQQENGSDGVAELVMQMLMSMQHSGVQDSNKTVFHLEVRSVSAEAAAVSAELLAPAVSESDLTGTANQQTWEAPDEEQTREMPVLPETAAGEEAVLRSPTALPEAEAVLPEEVKPLEQTSTAAQTAVYQEIPQETDARPESMAEPLRVWTAPAEGGTQIQREQPMPQEQDTAQTQTGVPEQTESPRSAAERMLGELLTKAREELGLTKAEFTVEKTAQTVRTPEQGLPEEQNAPQTRETRGTQTALAFQPNHRDGRGELDSILNGVREEKTDEPQKIPAERQSAQENGLLQSGLDREIAPVRAETVKIREIPPERQIAQELLSRSETLSGGRSEFTMELNPESLGRIIVRMASANGKVAVSITAENDATRQLLEARSVQLGTAMRENGVELERYQVVSGREEAQLMQDSYEGSSKNPYARQSEPEEGKEENGGDDFLEILQQL